MHVDFDPLQVDWSHYSTKPHEMLMMMEGGGSALMAQTTASYPVFTGVPYQRGAGLASMFRSFLRFLLPIGKAAGTAIGREGMATGARALNSMLEGQNVKETLVNEGKAGLKNLLEKAADNLGRQKGTGNFDFKRYKNALPGSLKKPSSSSIKRALKMENISPTTNSGLLRSTIGPAEFIPGKNIPHPNIKLSNKKRKHPNKKHKENKVTKRLRVDALGIY